MASGKTPTIGVQLIVRDEEDLLGRCLDSVRAWARQIVVVDTGSTDGTTRIASGLGAQVVDWPWSDDFAAARNAGLTHASTEWILVLDADEAVSEGAEALSAYLESVGEDCCEVVLRHRIGERPEDELTSRAIRLFRNGCGFRYEGRVHEQLVLDDGRPATGASVSPIKLIHDGYMPEQLARKGTALRNLRLLEQMLDDSPGDAFIRYNLGVASCQLGRLEKAAHLFEEALALAPEAAAYRPTLVRDYALLLTALDKRAASARLLTEETKHYPGYADLHWLRGQCLQAQGRLEAACQAYEAAANCGEEARSSYICLHGSHSFRPWTALAEIARTSGEWTLADRLYQGALASEPGYEAAWHGWAEALAEAGSSSDDVRQRFYSLYPGVREHSRTGLMAAKALAGIGGHREALALLKDSPIRHPELECRCLTALGAFSEVEQVVRQDMAVTGGVQPETLDYAILAVMNRGTALPDWLAAALGDKEAAGLKRLWERLQLRGATGRSENTGDDAPEDKAFLEAAERLSEKALATGLADLGEKLSAARGESAETLALRLFRRGYVLRAADRLLRLLQEDRLNAEGLASLGQILFLREHYATAASLFERALEQDSAYQDARLGAAECYARMVLEVAENGLRRHPGHPRLTKQRQRLNESLRLMRGLPWQIRWTGAERGHANG